jgi:hypothetical protein
MDASPTAAAHGRGQPRLLITICRRRHQVSLTAQGTVAQTRGTLMADLAGPTGGLAAGGAVGCRTVSQCRYRRSRELEEGRQTGLSPVRE